TALMQAVRVGHIKVVKLLIENHADVTIENKKGNTALKIAEKKGKPAIVKLIAERQRVQEDFLAAVEKGNLAGGK
ncbi:MAG TPA: ankyrin repeat domain-containing protein, partial [Candidatus Dependentiae bacterium]|nr:ankyrin repeat domain-containing protein [Candidatus Dependentiae bacterium]